MPLRRRRQRSPIDEVDATSLPPQYRAPVADALAARARFGELVATLRPGPLQERMTTLGDNVDAGVLAIWRTAVHAGDVERIAAGLDPERVTAELKRARRSGADPAVIATLTERFASTQRLLNSLDDLRERLPVLEARLATVVSRAAELALTSAVAPVNDELARLDADVAAVLVELDVLGQATGELA